MDAGCRSGLLLVQAKISLSVAKCEASEKWWPTWHLGKGKKKSLIQVSLLLGEICSFIIPPLASFLDGDTCKLITYLCYIVWIIYKIIMYKYICC